MALVIIPTRSDIPCYDFQITLDGVILNLEFAWSDRMSVWAMNIFDINSVAIVTGIPLFTEFPLLYKEKDTRLPKGNWFCVDTGNEAKNPGRDDFGSRVLLYYGDTDE